MLELYPVAVLAGGLGTRMASLGAKELPKALLPVAGRPFIDFKLESLAAQGIDHVVMLVGQGAKSIIEHVGDGGRFGLHVTYENDGPMLLGTGGAIRQALDQLGENFWVTYGDSYLRAPLPEVEQSFREHATAGLMTVLRNRDAWDRSNIRMEEGMVVEYRTFSPVGAYEYIDYGISILSKVPFLSWPAGVAFGLEEVLQVLIRQHELAAFVVTERFYEIGSPEGYRETEAFLRSLKRAKPTGD